jgi:hypothetical protein
MRSLLIATLAVALTTKLTSSFVIPTNIQTSTRPLFAWADDDRGSEFQDALARNVARTCVRNFLTQRAIQSFTFLLESCRDPHTVRWLEVSGRIKSKRHLQRTLCF